MRSTAKWTYKITILIMIMVMYSTNLLGITQNLPLFPTISASAKEEAKTDTTKEDDSKKESEKDSKEEETSEEKVSQKKNIYEALEDDAELLKSVLKTVEYNKQMQYLMTYTILSSAYNSENGYSDIYSTENGWANGAENNLAITVNTGYASALDKETASNSAEEKEEKEEKEKSKKMTDYASLDKTSKEIVDVLTNSLISLYSNRFSLKVDKDLSPKDAIEFRDLKQEVFYGNGAECLRIDTMFNWGKCDTGYFNNMVGGEKNGTSLGYLIRPNGKFNLDSSLVTKIKGKENSIYKAVFDKLQKASTQAVISGDVSSILGEEQYFSSSEISSINKLLDTSLAEYEGDKKSKNNTYIQSISSLQGNTSKTSYYYKSLIGGDYKKAEKVYKNYADLYKLYPSNQKKNSNFKTIYAQWVSDTLAKVKKIDKYQATLTANKKAQTDSVDDISAKAKSTKTLGWIPLRLVIADYKSKLTKNNEMTKLNKFFKAYDGGTVIDGGLVEQDNKKHRYLRINDLYNLEVKTASSLENSASPYLTSHYDIMGNKYGDANIGDTKSALGENNLGNYAGMYVPKVDQTVLGSLAGLFKSGKLSDTDLGIAKQLSADKIVSSDFKAVTKTIALKSSTASKVISKKDADYILGVDNYGNIISGETLQVVIPYWQNITISEFSGFNTKESQFLTSPTLYGAKDDFVSNTSTIYSNTTIKEKGITYSDKTKTALGLKDAQNKEFTKYLTSLDSSEDKIKKLTTNLESDSVSRQAYALAITQSTSGQVKKFNTRFMKQANEGKELYLVPSKGSEAKDTIKTEEEELNEFTAKDLLEKLRMLFDGGVYDLIRLTIASGIISFYTSNISNFTMGAIFHTTTIVESQMWSDILPSLVKILVAGTGVYLLILTFKVLRRTMTIKNLFKQFVMLTLVLLIPTLVYSPLVNLALNKPTDKVLGSQLEQMSIVDTLLEKETKLREYDKDYQRFFGNVEELRNKKDDYIVKLYTTTHVDGFDIETVTYDQLSDKNKFRNTALLTSGEWRKSDLVAIDVSIYDIFAWASDEKETRTLFDYLQATDSNRYEDVGKYNEYSVDTSYSNDILGISVSGKKWKASSIYKMLYANTTNEKISNSINGVYDITEVFRNRGNDTKKDLYTNKDKANLVRDLSMTSKSRTLAFGDGQTLSPTSMELYQTYSNAEYIPDSDIFGLQNIINTLVTFRAYNGTTLEGDTYEVNKKILDDYISNYSTVRETLGAENSKVKMAEFRIITLNMWFETNNLLGLDMFPQEYRPETISFDSYMRLVYIPLSSYSNLEDKGLDNVGKYVGLRYHPVTLIAFLGAILALLLFGFIYVLVFYVLLMALMVGMFIYNYVIKSNYDSKAWLGSLFIIGTFALAKLGLLCIWYGMGAVMNYTYLANDGESYPYVLIHSVIIMAYVIFLVAFVFKKVFKNVVEDLSNLGANGFVKDSKNILNKIKNPISSISGMSNKLGSATGSAGKSFGKGIEKVLGSEGALGSPSKKAMATVGSMFSMSNLKNIVNRNSSGNQEDVSTIQDKLEGKENPNVKKSIVDKIGGSVIKGIKGKAMRKVGKAYANIIPKALGLSNTDKDKLESSGSLGKVIHSADDDGVLLSKMDIGNTAVATNISNRLTKKGIKSMVDDEGNLLFDSTKVNLDNRRERKEVFGESIEDLAQDLDNINYTSKEKLPNDYSRLSYAKTKDGYDLRIGKDGISSNSVDELLDSDLFHSNFELLEEIPKDANGNYMSGNMKVVPKNKDVNVNDVLSQMGNLESSLRNSNNDVARELPNTQNALNFANPSDLAIAEDMLTDGMELQDGRVLYDNKNVKHQKAVAKMSSAMDKSSTEDYKEKSNILSKLTSQVVLGENNGYDLGTVNTNENPEAYQQAVTSGIISPNENVSTVYLGNKSGEVVSQLKDISKIATTKSHAVSNFFNAKENLLSRGEGILTGGLDNSEGSIGYLDVMNNSIDELGLESPKIDSIRSQYDSLKNQKSIGGISDHKYDRHLEILKSNLQSTLNDEGVLSKVQAKSLSNHIESLQDREKETSNKKEKTQLKKEITDTNKVLNNFAKANEQILAEGINPENAEKLIGSRSLDELQGFAKNLTGVTSNVDGTVELKTSSKTTDKASIEKALKTLLGTN